MERGVEARGKGGKGEDRWRSPPLRNIQGQGEHKVISIFSIEYLSISLGKVKTIQLKLQKVSQDNCRKVLFPDKVLIFDK